MMALKSAILSVTTITRTFFCFQNQLPTKAPNVTHEITPALPTKISREILSLSVLVLGNKAHETSASWNYMLLGYTPEIKCLGEIIAVKITCKETENYTIVWGNLTNNGFAKKELFCQPTHKLRGSFNRLQ